MSIKVSWLNLGRTCRVSWSPTNSKHLKLADVRPILYGAYRWISGQINSLCSN